MVEPSTFGKEPASGGTGGPPGPRERRDRARAGVLRSAIELAAEAPFRELTVARIADAAGIARSAFYTHFADRNELLLEAISEVSEELRGGAEGLWRSAGAPAGRVRRAVETIVSAYGGHAAVLRVAAEVAAYDADVRVAWLAIQQRYIEAIADHVRSEQRAGLVAPTHRAEEIAEALVWMTERCCDVYLSRGDRAAEDVVEALAPLWTAALYPGLITADELRPQDVEDAAGGDSHAG